MERRVAGIFGDRGWRVHDDANKTSDVIVPGKLVIEVKSTKGKGPAWLQKAKGQRLLAMQEEGLPGLIVFTCICKETGRRIDWAIEPLPVWLAAHSYEGVE
ncbi:hypothetical protein LCGC14_2233370, partial [marine sediment metagenome]